MSASGCIRSASQTSGRTLWPNDGMQAGTQYKKWLSIAPDAPRTHPDAPVQSIRDAVCIPIGDALRPKTGRDA
jgi:hypothetical protein